ncbi:polysaccharide biosynthesis tyrosine autokinase [uncultured Desulfobulbus sp.]|uniref:GumC family protein n=1 Tax=uncultured Desulfobulbus sp. TaxID=239745 RepID=UPI0029C79840|nr:polysaccharide biosynthesis tyrosine autokinase [uncultured Desulfobulbus sp.]
MRKEQNGNTNQQVQTTVVHDDAVGAEYETIDIQEYIGILFRRYRLMIAVMLIVLMLGAIYTLTRTHIYQTTAKIVVVTSNTGGSASSSSIPLLNDLQALTKSRSTDTQVEIISSHDLIDKAYHSMRMGEKIITTDGRKVFYERVYDLDGNLVADSTVEKKHTKDSKGNLISDELLGKNGQHVATLIYSKNEHLDSIENLAAGYAIENGTDDNKMLYDGFTSEKNAPEWSYRVDSKKNTDVISITAMAYTPIAAAAFANNIANSYLKEDLDNNQSANEEAMNNANSQMEKFRKLLDVANEKLSKYKERNGIIDASTQVSAIAEHMAKLQTDTDTVKVDIAANEKEIGNIETQLNGQSKKIISSSTITRNPDFEGVIAKLNELNSKRASMMQEYRPTSDEMIALNGEIKAEESRLKEIAEKLVSSETESDNPIYGALAAKYSDSISMLAANTARLNAMDSIYKGRKKELAALPEQQSKLANLMQEVSLLNNTYELISQKYYTLLLSQNSTLKNGKIISTAKSPTGPTYPNKSKNAVLFFLLGCMLSVAVAIIAEKLDIRLHDQATAERIAGVPTLSVIPEIAEGETNIISDIDRNSLLLESYRILRNNISFSSVDREIKLLAVTSPGRGEGKSTTATNLAVAMAMDGKRVLLIDCDLRRPSAHRKLAVSRDIGFTNVVTNTCKLEDAIVQTSVENLFLLPAGPIPPNPTEILNSQRSHQIFEQIRDMYDTIIVDCPPCVGLSDVQVLSTLVDGLILLVAMDQTLRPHLQIAMRALNQVDAPLIGVVLNRMEIRRQGYNSYYSYYYYYNYDYTQDSEHREKYSKVKRRRGAKGKDSNKPK